MSSRRKSNSSARSSRDSGAARASSSRSGKTPPSSYASVPMPQESRSAQLSRRRAADKARQQRKARIRLIVGFILFIILAIGLIVGGYALYNSDLLKVENIVVSGNSHLTNEQIVSEAEVPEGATMLKIPIEEIENRVAKNPWVESVSVSRRLPNTLKISIDERVPIAVVTPLGSQEGWAFSLDGYWLEPASEEISSTVIAVQGPLTLTPKAGVKESDKAIGNARSIINMMTPELREEVVAIKAESVESTELTTKDGISIYVGSVDRFEEKDKIIRAMLQEHEGKIVYINVRVPDSPTWRGKVNP